MDQYLRTALWGRLDDATPAQLGRPFAHRREPHTRATLFGYAYAVIDDLQRHIVIHGESNDACPCPGVTHHVSKRLVRDAVDGHFDGCGEIGKVFVGLHGHAQLLTFRAVALGESAYRLYESQIVEGRGSEVVDQAS